MRRNITGNVLGIINGNISVIITSTFWGIINDIMKGMIKGIITCIILSIFWRIIAELLGLHYGQCWGTLLGILRV